MYLHDYQLNTLRKLRRGGNFILHGPRRIGMTQIIINRALVYVGENNGAEVTFLSPDAKMMKYNLRYMSDTIYASKGTRVSAFDSTLTLKSQTNDTLSFTNGSVIKFISETTCPPERVMQSTVGDLFIMDNADGISNMDVFMHASKLCDQVIISTTGGMHKSNSMYHLHVASVRGTIDFDYIRFPMEVVTPKQMELYDEMRNQLNPVEWVHDMEMIPYI